MEKDIILNKVIPSLQKNRMQAFYAEKKEDVIAQISQLVKEGDVVANGGSKTLEACGVIDYLRSGRFHYLDRGVQGLTQEQIRQVYLQSFGADAYFCSSNAVTLDGELYNVDGNCNRISAISFGPKSVIMVVGKNKIVNNLEESVCRVKEICAPENCRRLSKATYCAKHGKCISLSRKNAPMASGCASPDRICCSYLVCGYQRIPDRIKVILVGEDLGY